MKLVLSLFLFGIVSILSAQDTTELVNYPENVKTFKLIIKKDTTLIWTYPNGKKDSECPVKKHELTGINTRWYENGKLMWEKELVKGIQHGKSIFYDQKGIRVAELIYENGIVVDTLFVKDKLHLVVGKITFKSIVYGGMQREDVSSNVSEHSGPFINYSMYAAKIDSIKKTELIQNFKSDFRGEFFIIVPEGSIAFFPKSMDMNSLLPGEFNFPQKVNYSGNESWSMNGPTIVSKDDLILFITLHHSSVGYAP